MELLANSGCNVCIDDTIDRYANNLGVLDKAAMVMASFQVKVYHSMDCDDHPSCDCYSQCHAIVW